MRSGQHSLFAQEHLAAVSVIVVDGGGAEGIGGADPVRYAAGDHRGVSVGPQHLHAAHLHALLALPAVVVTAHTLREGHEGRVTHNNGRGAD